MEIHLTLYDIFEPIPFTAPDFSDEDFYSFLAGTLSQEKQQEISDANSDNPVREEVPYRATINLTENDVLKLSIRETQEGKPEGVSLMLDIVHAGPYDRDVIRHLLKASEDQLRTAINAPLPLALTHQDAKITVSGVEVFTTQWHRRLLAVMYAFAPRIKLLPSEGVVAGLASCSTCGKQLYYKLRLDKNDTWKKAEIVCPTGCYKSSVAVVSDITPQGN